jgi:hypothetical protein
MGGPMAVHEILRDIKGSVALAATDAPDDYATWSSWNFESHMADLKELWASVEPILKDRSRAQQVGSDLSAMISAFESGDKIGGRKIAWKLYNNDLPALN